MLATTVLFGTVTLIASVYSAWPLYSVESLDDSVVYHTAFNEMPQSVDIWGPIMYPLSRVGLAIVYVIIALTAKIIFYADGRGTRDELIVGGVLLITFASPLLLIVLQARICQASRQTIPSFHEVRISPQLYVLAAALAATPAWTMRMATEKAKRS
jgi:hypothetical protein